MNPSDTAPAIHLVDTGTDRSAPPIVLVHGLTFDSTAWRPVVAALRSRHAGRRIVLVDLPGHDTSPACPPHNLERVCDLLHQSLRAADVVDPILVGHSMSGVLVSMYGAKYPVTAVVNVDQPLQVGPFAALVRRLWPRLQSAEFRSVLDEVVAASFHLELLAPAVRAFVESASRPQREVVLSYWQEIVDRPADELQAIIDGSLPAIGAKNTPYLLVLGTSMPDALRAHLSGVLPSVRIVEWAGSGHFPHLAHPEAFADLIGDLERDRDLAAVTRS